MAATQSQTVKKSADDRGESASIASIRAQKGNCTLTARLEPRRLSRDKAGEVQIALRSSRPSPALLRERAASIASPVRVTA